MWHYNVTLQCDTTMWHYNVTPQCDTTMWHYNVTLQCVTTMCRDLKSEMRLHTSIDYIYLLECIYLIIHIYFTTHIYLLMQMYSAIHIDLLLHITNTHCRAYTCFHTYTYIYSLYNTYQLTDAVLPVVCQRVPRLITGTRSLQDCSSGHTLLVTAAVVDVTARSGCKDNIQHILTIWGTACLINTTFLDLFL